MHYHCQRCYKYHINNTECPFKDLSPRFIYNPDESKYLSINPFSSIESDSCIIKTNIKILTTKADRYCSADEIGLKRHLIPAGTRAWREKRIEDGDFGSTYLCLECFNQWLKNREKEN